MCVYKVPIKGRLSPVAQQNRGVRRWLDFQNFSLSLSRLCFCVGPNSQFHNNKQLTPNK